MQSPVATYVANATPTGSGNAHAPLIVQRFEQKRAGDKHHFVKMVRQEGGSPPPVAVPKSVLGTPLRCLNGTRVGQTKRATVYIEPTLHRALRLKSVETSRSLSDLVNDAIREDLAADADDLATFDSRRTEPTVSFEDFVKELKRNGKL